MSEATRQAGQPEQSGEARPAADPLETRFADYETYEVKDVAAFLGRDEWFIRKLETKGVIRRAKGLGRRILFFGSEVKRCIRELRGEEVSGDA